MVCYRGLYPLLTGVEVLGDSVHVPNELARLLTRHANLSVDCREKIKEDTAAQISQMLGPPY